MLGSDKLNLSLKLLAFILLFSLYLFTSLFGLYGEEINPDGINWLNRTQDFTYALKSNSYGRTYQAYHPGVTLMWISGPLLNTFVNNLEDPEKSSDELKPTFMERYNNLKVSLFIFYSFMYLLIGILLWKLVSFKYFFIFSIFYILEPFVIGMRRLYHLDFLMGILVFTSFLFFIYFNYKKQNWIFLICAGLFFALGLLTKSAAIIFLPAIPFIFLLGNSVYWKKILGLLVFIVSTTFFIYAFFPALWKDPIKAFPEYYQKISYGVSDIGIEGRKEMGTSGNSENKTLDETLDAKISLFYLISLFMRLSPASGIFLIVSVSVLLYFLLKGFFEFMFKSIIKKDIQKVFNYSPEAWLAFWSLGISLAVIVALGFAVKKSDRYEILIFPFLFTIFAYFLSKLKSWYLIPLILIYTAVVYFDLRSFHPFYLAYTNPFMGGIETRLRSVDDAPFGIGSYQAFEVIKQDREENNYEGFYTVAGSKSIKAISSGGKFSRFPSCVTDYVISYALEENPMNTCSQQYVLLDTVKVGGFDYWYVYKRLNQKHASNYE